MYVYSRAKVDFQDKRLRNIQVLKVADGFPEKLNIIMFFFRKR